jgi:hypothetical protein
MNARRTGRDRECPERCVQRRVEPLGGGVLAALGQPRVYRGLDVARGESLLAGRVHRVRCGHRRAFARRHVRRRRRFARGDDPLLDASRLVTPAGGEERRRATAQRVEVVRLESQRVLVRSQRVLGAAEAHQHAANADVGQDALPGERRGRLVVAQRLGETALRRFVVAEPQRLAVTGVDVIHQRGGPSVSSLELSASLRDRRDLARRQVRTLPRGGTRVFP